MAHSDVDKTKALLEFMKKEQKNNCWRRTKHVTGKKRRRNVLSVKIPIVDEKRNTTTKECVTHQDIFESTEPVLADRFSGAFSLSFYSGRLFNELGFMGDYECVQRLKGPLLFLEELIQLPRCF